MFLKLCLILCVLIGYLDGMYQMLGSILGHVDSEEDERLTDCIFSLCLYSTFHWNSPLYSLQLFRLYTFINYKNQMAIAMERVTDEVFYQPRAFIINDSPEVQLTNVDYYYQISTAIPSTHSHYRYLFDVNDQGIDRHSIKPLKKSGVYLYRDTKQVTNRSVLTSICAKMWVVVQ